MSVCRGRSHIDFSEHQANSYIEQRSQSSATAQVIDRTDHSTGIRMKDHLSMGSYNKQLSVVCCIQMPVSGIRIPHQARQKYTQH